MNSNVILLAEDNPDHALLTSEALESVLADGTSVHVVRDGQQLLEYLYAALEGADEPIPQLIVLDVQMPGMSGFEVIETIKSDPRLHAIPVVVLTSSDDPRDIARSYDLGSASYVQKPTGPGELHARIAEIPSYFNQSPPERTTP